MLLTSVTTKPADGAGAVSVTVPSDALPPVTVDGVSVSPESDGVDAAACGVKLRTDDHGPVAPEALTARAEIGNGVSWDYKSLQGKCSVVE